MLTDKSKYREEGYIADELFSDEQYELERQCMTVREVVRRKVFTLSEALENYEVTMEQYITFLAKGYFDNITSNLNNDADKLTQMSVLLAMDKVVKRLFAENGQHEDLLNFYSSFHKLTKDVEKDELKLSL